MSRVKKTKTIWRVLLRDFCWFSFVRNSLCCIKIGPKTVPWIQIMLVKNIVLMFWYWAMHMGLITHNNFSVKRKDSGVGSDENLKKNLPEVFLCRPRKHVYQCSVCHSNAFFGSICLWPHIHLRLYVIIFILPNAPTSCVSCGRASGNRNNEGRKSTPKFVP